MLFRLRKIAVATLVTLAGATGLLVVAHAGQDDGARSEVTVLADSPWDKPLP